MRRQVSRDAWRGGTRIAGSSRVVPTPCPLLLARLRAAPGSRALRVRAVVEEPHGAAGGSNNGGGGGSRGGLARQSSIRWARRQRMLASEPLPGAGEDDLLELNVGGRLMQTTRSTLQLVPGSRLAAMFRKGGEAELSYDASGRVWLDYDPSLFQLVLRYLREAKMNGGDSVELIMRQGQHHNQLLLKVNGQAIDVINRLPSFRHWSWYVGLWAGGDISCAVFQRDQYAVYWGDYAVKRYL